MELFLGILLLLVAIVLIVVVLMQEGNSRGLGAISGGADTFFGKQKGKSMSGLMVKATIILAILFVILCFCLSLLGDKFGSADVEVTPDTIVEATAETATAETAEDEIAEDADVAEDGDVVEDAEAEEVVEEEIAEEVIEEEAVEEVSEEVAE